MLPAGNGPPGSASSVVLELGAAEAAPGHHDDSYDWGREPGGLERKAKS